MITVAETPEGTTASAVAGAPEIWCDLEKNPAWLAGLAWLSRAERYDRASPRTVHLRAVVEAMLAAWRTLRPVFELTAHVREEGVPYRPAYPDVPEPVKFCASEALDDFVEFATKAVLSPQALITGLARHEAPPGQREKAGWDWDSEVWLLRERLNLLRLAATAPTVPDWIRDLVTTAVGSWGSQSQVLLEAGEDLYLLDHFFEDDGRDDTLVQVRRICLRLKQPPSGSRLDVEDEAKGVMLELVEDAIRASSGGTTLG